MRGSSSWNLSKQMIMGNCPSGFQYVPGGTTSCVVDCPQDRGYSLYIKDGIPTCRYREMNDKIVPLKTVSVVVPEQGKTLPSPLTLDAVRSLNPSLHGDYVAAVEDFNGKIAIVDSTLNRDQQIEASFRDLQLAESTRAEAPQVYENARIAYYTLLEGEGWKEKEKERIEKVEIEPAVSKYQTAYREATERVNQTVRTIDVVNGVKDKVLSLKDDFQYSSDLFNKQLEEIKNQIQIEKRSRIKKEQVTYDWVHTIMNVFVIVALLVAAFTVYRKLTAYPSPQYGVPMRRF